MLLLEDMPTKIMNALNINIEFGYDLENDDSFSMIEDVEYNLEKVGLFSSCSVDNGVSKIVIIPKNSAYVVKTPLFGSFYYPEFYNEEAEEYERDWDNPQFEFYEGAGYEDAEIDCSNYCELEEYLYSFAVDENVSEMFAETKFLGYAKHNRPCYISEKCKPFNWSKKANEKSKTLVTEKKKSKTPGWDRMQEEITALFIDEYGVEKTFKLIDFLVKYDINDLHENNVMISEKTGKIVISDYSGFRH